MLRCDRTTTIDFQPQGQHEGVFLIQTTPSNTKTTSKVSHLWTDPKSYQVLESSRLTLLQRAIQAPDASHFVADVHEINNKNSRRDQAPTILKTPISLYITIIRDLDALGWDKVKSVEEDLRSVSLVFSDSMKRNHTVIVSFPPTYPNSAPKCEVSLPQPLELRWEAGRMTLASVLDQCKEAASQYTSYFEHIDDLENNTWVAPIEPGSRTRVVKLGNHCSLHVKLNPFRLDDMPELHFTGPNAQVVELNNTFRQNVAKWSPNRLLRENIEILLGSTLPPRPIDVDVSDADECAICYSGTNHDQNRTCGECGRLFHAECLSEWLRSLPNSRLVGTRLVGPCPTCDQEVSM
ncbi:hypothetical protein SmJEL517_g06251 [Synchytrium microbalum]|uniref:RING-type domain-containing protein n=1 Tax=Synchytrium microbalum TaxID=1806994 RepID=A0A507BQH4_9FUNG|nr:uncharacterized protein SmJEL517_g06251 [Synchytrium microbalum]TPX30102.1 hypothetical protein SmJEL517_g06251 [Synchytrium microbalum]